MRNCGAVLLAPLLLEAVDVDLALGHLELLAVARALVGLAALHADGRVDRRALDDAPGGQRHVERRDAPGVRDLALGVAGGRDRAQPRDGDVLLGQRHEEALHAPRAADEDEQQPGGERVQRARVAGLAHAEQPPRGERQVVRGLPRGLVDEDEAVHLTAARRPARAGRRRGPSSDISVAKPAAWRCPPPPPARAMTETSTLAVGGAQRDLAPPAAAVGQLAREGGDLGALDRAQVVDDALRVAVLGARAGGSRRA